MKIKKIRLVNFMGYYGVNEFDLGNINVLCSQNGTGKTSLLEAIRYGLTGVEPSREIISEGCMDCSVDITLEDGNVYTREKRTDKPNRCKINGKVTTAASMNEAIETACGVKMADIKIATSSDVIAALKPEELGKFLVSYISEKLTLPKIMGYIPDVTTGMDAMLSGFFPEEFTMDDVTDAYNFFFAQRKVYKQTRVEYENKLKGLPEEAPGSDRKQLEEAESAIKNSAAAKRLYEQQKNAYETAVKNAEAQKASIKKLETEAAAITAKRTTDEERNKITEKREQIKVKGNEYAKVSSTLKANLELLERSLANLDKKVCPLSESLVCTTDKSKIRSELEESIRDTKESVKVQDDAINSMMTEYKKLEKELTAFDENKHLYEKKVFILKQISDAKKNEITIPAEPVAPKMISAAEADSIKRALAAWNDWEQAEKLRKKLAEVKIQESDSDKLVKAFEEKGCVKTGVMKYYMSVFEAKLNEKASTLKPGLTYCLKAENGVKAYCDLDGSGNFFPIESLSGGEKMLMVYAIMCLINELSGMRLVVLDELSVLDKNSLEALLDTLVAHKGEYDHAILAMVNHKDALNAIEKHKTDVTKLGLTV